jgi:PPOX class probable F420-dependent enzyme
MAWSRAELDAFLTETPRIARLSTTSAEGAPHVAPVWFRFDGDRLLVHTDAGSRKARNVLATRRHSTVVDKETVPYKGAIVHGRADIAGEVAWEPLIRDLAVAYVGPQDGPAFGQAIVDLPGEHVVLGLYVERWYTWDYSAWQ